LRLLDRLSINPVPNLTKIQPVGAKLFHTDRRTKRHVTKLIIAFRNFANAPKISNTLPFAIYTGHDSHVVGLKLVLATNLWTS